MFHRFRLVVQTDRAIEDISFALRAHLCASEPMKWIERISTDISAVFEGEMTDHYHFLLFNPGKSLNRPVFNCELKRAQDGSEMIFTRKFTLPTLGRLWMTTVCFCMGATLCVLPFSGHPWFMVVPGVILIGLPFVVKWVIDGMSEKTLRDFALQVLMRKEANPDERPIL